MIGRGGFCSRRSRERVIVGIASVLLAHAAHGAGLEFGETAFVLAGACCIGDECQVVEEDLCIAEGGSYFGDGTDCDPNPCAPLGACCDRFGLCGITTEDDCNAPGEQTYWHGGQTCDPNPCVGACCTDAGNCTLTSRYLCLVNGGDHHYWGDGTVCEPNPCEPHIGACCYGEQQCVVVTRWSCVEDCGCDYLGDGTDCDPDPCITTPTDEATWGRIKLIYR